MKSDCIVLSFSGSVSAATLEPSGQTKKRPRESTGPLARALVCQSSREGVEDPLLG